MNHNIEVLIGITAAKRLKKAGINPLTASEQELEYVAGAKAAQKILAAKSLLFPNKEVKQVRSSGDAYNIVAPYLTNLDHEQFWVAALNRANKLIDVIQISQGGMTGTVVDTKILFKRLLVMGACNFIVAHNHPSGNLQPSGDDVNITEKIKNAGLLLDMKLLDHIIVGGTGYYSFADNGFL